MVIMGSGGHAKEVLEVLLQIGYNFPIALYNDITPHEQIPTLFQSYPILRKKEDLKKWFKGESSSFVLGIGGITNRIKMWDIAIENGGHPIELISGNCSMGKLDVHNGLGLNVMQFVFVSNSVAIGTSVLLNTRCNIHHDVTIGDFCEIGPGALILGRCKIGTHTFIGAGAIVLPNITIGNYCTVGAGAVVTKNIEDHKTVKGNPAH